jgi:hypothetical protein
MILNDQEILLDKIQAQGHNFTTPPYDISK